MSFQRRAAYSEILSKQLGSVANGATTTTLTISAAVAEKRLVLDDLLISLGQAGNAIIKSSTTALAPRLYFPQPLTYRLRDLYLTGFTGQNLTIAITLDEPAVGAVPAECLAEYHVE